MAGPNEPKVSWSILQTLVAWLVSGMVAWAIVQSRVAVLEERVDQLRADIVEIKSDVKTLLRHVR